TMLAPVIGHCCADVVCAEVQRQLPIIQQQHAILEIGASDGQVEERLYRRCAALLHLGLGRVGGSVGINDEVDNGMLKAQVLQVDPNLNKRENAQPHVNPVRMRIRLLVGSLATVDGQIVSFKFKRREFPVKGPQVNPSAGG